MHDPEHSYEFPNLDDYYTDFNEHFWKPGTRFWKLERGQHYAEPANPSWVAFNQGNWTHALELIEADRDRLTRYHQRCNDLDITTRRVRVIETPISPYLQWELHLLHLRDQTGGPIRVIHADKIIERGGKLPDWNVIAPDVMYRVGYDHHGVLETAARTVSASSIKTVVRFIGGLYGRAEPITDYFAREIAHLPPPEPGQSLPDNYLQAVGRPNPPRT